MSWLGKLGRSVAKEAAWWARYGIHDPDSWVGFTTDPALTTRPVGWVRVGPRTTIYVEIRRTP